MESSDFEKTFDLDEQDIVDDLDLTTIRRPNFDLQNVDIELPRWVVRGLDKEAARLGVTRQSIIKVWLAERIEKGAAKQH